MGGTLSFSSDKTFAMCTFCALSHRSTSIKDGSCEPIHLTVQLEQYERGLNSLEGSQLLPTLPCVNTVWLFA